MINLSSSHAAQLGLRVHRSQLGPQSEAGGCARLHTSVSPYHSEEEVARDEALLSCMNLKKVAGLHHHLEQLSVRAAYPVRQPIGHRAGDAQLITKQQRNGNGPAGLEAKQLQKIPCVRSTLKGAMIQLAHLA
mmetsp:Transcript_21867/g.41903  ORF Transcript_21867/g.41903 Transcript_21867/m.41903 type:complete len:133 (+) Transcript_21867:242-640(+)